MDEMTQEEAMNMNNEQAINILIPLKNMMRDQHGCPISDAYFALDKAIEALLSQPEIIRCKECKHRHEAECPMYHEEDIEWDDDGYIERETIYHDWTEDDGYCDRGERRTDEIN